ncbi:S-layer protein [Candidatus Woesearchaeota archaeon]|nr:S-layer protein [Candidatus Woesearchaeota archaeon]
MRKTVKKIAALVAGTTMVGATIMGAMALDLSNYPAPFVANGVFDGKIVVGAKAATSDVVGAIDLAASLQASASTTTEVELPDAAGKATVTGDSAEFKTGNDFIRIGETIGSVKSTFRHTDLDALKSGVFDTGESTTPVNQYLKFDNTTMSVTYAENDDDEVGDFLKITDGSTIFEYHMEFTEGAAADNESNALNDFESEVLTILGAPFTITTASMANGNDMSLTLLGGEVADTLKDGETKTYTIDGKDYEVTAVFISSDDQSAKLSVNGMLTKELNEGETDVLSSEVTVGVQEILTNQREGIVEFFLGANKIELTDTDFTDSTYAQGTVKVNSESISDAYLIIKGTAESSTTTKLNYIKYKVLADDDIYVPAGKGVKEYMTEPEGLLTDTWDIKYAGLMNTGVSTIKFNAKSDHSYDLEFVNVNGDAYSFPFITNKNSIFKYGDDDDDFIFTEPTYWGPIVGTTPTNNATFISDNDYFLLSDRATGTTDDSKAVSSVLRYQSISTGDSTVTFRDLAGDTIVVSYSGTVGSTATGELIVAGKTHDFYVGASSATASEDYALTMDLDGNDAINATELKLVAKGGAVLDLGNGTQIFSLGDSYDNLTNPYAITDYSDVVNVSITTPASLFDESGDGPISSDLTITSATANKISSTVNDPTLVDDPENDDYSYGYDIYGAKYTRYYPSSGTEAAEITIDYPLTQKGAQVFVTAGVVEVKEGTATSGGTISSTTLNPIAVGLAVLDTEAPALGSENMIVVGGPCVNTAAAELMGNPATCTEGFTPGKAVIKLFADKNALLVAGYGAQDTLGACYVLADYEDYDLSGTEAEVVVADLNTITVNKVG